MPADFKLQNYGEDMKKKILIFLGLCFSLLLVGCSDKLSYPKIVNTYNMDITYIEEQQLVEGKVNVGYVNQTDTTLSEAKFHLYPNAFRENSKASVVSLANKDKAYPNGNSYGNITIKSVTLNGENKEIEICGEDENILNVVFEKQLYPNERVEIEICFQTKLANINHRLGYGKNCVNICNFYPVACVYDNGEYQTDLYNSNGDPFYSKVANYNVNFTYPSDYILASTGVGEIASADGQNVASIVAEGVRDFGIVISKNYQILSNEVNNIKINYFYHSDENAEQSLKLANSVVEYFSENFGQYPYKELDVVETNFVHGGMEYPNLVLISDDLADYETYQNVIIHEIAHQWWYGVVGNDQYSNGWIDEGLAEFSTALFYDACADFELSREQIVRNATTSYATFMRVYGDVLGEIDTSMNRELDEFATEPEYVYNTYTKGLLMFASLYELIGEDDFFDCLQYYYRTCAFLEAKPEDVIYCFSRASGRDLSGFFNSWINGKVVIVMPE